MIDKTIKNIKKIPCKVLEGLLYSKNSKYKKKNLSFLYIKELNTKMSLISAKVYERTGASHLIIKRTE